jgi:uncharacterized membrane protein
VFDTVFEFLFKYRPLVFEQGDFALSAGRSLSLALGAGGVAVLSAVLSYRWAARASSRDRAILITLRAIAVAIMLFCLMRPVLILRASVPQQNYVAVLLDDSRSMRIPDQADGPPRGAFIASNFAEPASPLFAGLSKRFNVRMYRFSSAAERVASRKGFTFGGTETRLGQALADVREELSGLPLSGVVVVTDGADTSGVPLTDTINSLKAASVPVFTIGLGPTGYARDIQVGRIDVPRTVLKGSSLVVEVVLEQQGFRGAVVPVQVESDGRIVSSQDVTLGPDGEPTAVRVRFTASEGGTRMFRVRVPPQEGEALTQNNARDALVEVEDARAKILYFEGEPRFELKFIRRAVADDQNLQVVSLLRTAENRYYRLEVDDREELSGGFPETREELFAYRALVIGSVEAGAFSADQQRMIAEFVDRRGGGLLVLGGRRSFAEGGFSGTPLADVLPVVVEGPGLPNRPGATDLKVRPTRDGATHPATQIAATEQASLARWNDLPTLSSVNDIRRTKLGATVLLTGGTGSREQVVLAWHRFGRGKAVAFTAQDSWIWQMHAKMSIKDETHEMFWRQLLRWLVDGVPGQLSILTSRDRVEPGETIELRADVADKAFAPVTGARVVAEIIPPAGTGTPMDIALAPNPSRQGEYGATFAAQVNGLHEVRVTATQGDAPIASNAAHVAVGPSEAEYFDATLQETLLRRLSSETGGRFYTPDTAARLAEDISYAGRGVTVAEEKELWDMPILLVVLLGAVLGDWTFRRARGLP